MATARLFQSGGSQAVRLPKEFRFEGAEEVEIFRRGDEVVLREKQSTMARAFELITMLPPEIDERDDTPPQVRSGL
ncbi:MAG: antitoxin [Fimbriimonadales bacterium]